MIGLLALLQRLAGARPAAAPDPVRLLEEEARCPDTPPDRLAEIMVGSAGKKDGNTVPLKVAEAVAENPNTPARTLGYLAGTNCAAAVARNPVLPLLAFGDPDAILAWKLFAHEHLLALPETPAALVTLLAGAPDPEIAEEARWHVAFGDDPDASLPSWRSLLVSRLQRIADKARDRDAASLHELHELGLLPAWLSLDRVPRPVLRPPSSTGGVGGAKLEETSATAQSLIRRVSDPRTRNWALLRIAKSKRTEAAVLHAIARRPDISSNVLLAILRRSQTLGPSMDECIYDILQHPSANAAVLRVIVLRAQTPAARRAALRHPAASAGLTGVCREAALTDAKMAGNLPASRFFATLQPARAGLLFSRTQAPLIQRLASVLVGPAGRDEATLKAFAEDGSRLVRAAARARLAGEFEPADVFRADFASKEPTDAGYNCPR